MASSSNASTSHRLPLPHWVATFRDYYFAARPGTRLLVGVLAVVMAVVSLLSAPDFAGILGAILGVVLLMIAVIDWQYFIIPNALSAAGVSLAMVHAAVQGPGTMLASIGLAVMRAVTFAAVLLAIRYAYQRVRGCEGIGLGDVKLAGVAGAWLDWSVMPVSIEIAACAALSTYLFRQLALGQPAQATTRLPFGTFFAPAIWACWVLQMTIL